MARRAMTMPDRTSARRIVISEVLAHTDQPVGDWIELHNAGDEPVTITGWYLSDEAARLDKYRIGDVTIPPHGYHVFTQRDHFGGTGDPDAFGISERGSSVYLSQGNPDGTLGISRTMVTFGASERELTLGGFQTSDGLAHFVPLASATPWEPNDYPKIGPVIISELMYNPQEADDPTEFIELLNLAGEDVPLFDPARPEESLDASRRRRLDDSRRNHRSRTSAICC